MIKKAEVVYVPRRGHRWIVSFDDDRVHKSQTYRGTDSYFEASKARLRPADINPCRNVRPVLDRECKGPERCPGIYPG